MIHLILHAVSSRGGSGTCDKEDEAVTRYVIRIALKFATAARPRKAIDYEKGTRVSSGCKSNHRLVDHLLFRSPAREALSKANSHP
jgi:hypothetical protein